MKSTVTMSIGDIAARFGLATHVLRHWEKMGLLTPSRIGGDHRRYGTDHLYRVAAIQSAKEAGFSLEEIREMLAASDAAERHAVLARLRAKLARRLAEVQSSLELIDGALGCEHEDLLICPHFQAMLAERVSAAPPPRI